MKNKCFDPYFLSTIACQLSECFTEEELAFLAASLTALGYNLEVILARRSACKESCSSNTEK